MMTAVDRKDQVRPAGAMADRPTRLQTVIWATILALMVIISIIKMPSFQVGIDGDDASYVILARSLINSPTYGLAYGPGQPFESKYPFGYPLVLAPLTQIFPGNLDVLKVPSLVASILISAILFWGWHWFYPKKSYWWGLAITSLVSLAPLTIDHTRRVMSEPVFTLFCLVSILLAEQYVRGKRAWWWAPAMAAALIFTMFTRTIGVVLVAIVFIYLLARIGLVFWKKMVLIILLMAVLLGIVVILTPVRVADLLPTQYLNDENARFIVALFYSKQSAGVGEATPSPVTPQPEATAPLNPPAQSSSSFGSLLFFGLKYHFGIDVRSVVLPIGGGPHEQDLARQIHFRDLPMVIGYFISIVTGVGLFWLLKLHLRSLFLLFAAVYFASTFLWVWNGPRLLYPIQPQILFAFLAGIEAISVWITGLFHWKPGYSVNVTFVVAAVFVLFIASVYKSALIDDSRIHAGDLRLRTAWLISHSGPDDILMTEAPTTDYLYWGKKTVYYPALYSTDQFEDYLVTQKVSYLLIAPMIRWQEKFTPDYSSDLIKFFPEIDQLVKSERLNLVYSSEPDGIKVYQVQP